VSPVASASPECLADWLELKAIASADKNSAIEDLISEIQRSGSTDALVDPEEDDEDVYASDPRSEKAQQVSSDAFAEVERRETACRSFADATLYPFDVGQRYLQLFENGDVSIYTFLLLLSAHGQDAGPKGLSGARLFEEVCTSAVARYLGSPAGRARAVTFGFPRRLLPKNFRTALDQICKDLGENSRCSTPPGTKNQKDAKLDIVAWSHFADRRPGQLIAFGQCATGDHWKEKRTELLPDAWCRAWLTSSPLVLPIRTFFVPHQLEVGLWEETSIYAGIVFDRCRITSLCDEVDPDLIERCAEWSRYVIECGVLG
jgi:hypothetical protein